MSTHRQFIPLQLRSIADAELGRLWADADLRRYRLGRAAYERLQRTVDDAFWLTLRIEWQQRTEQDAISIATAEWRNALRRERARLDRAAGRIDDAPDRRPLPEQERTPNPPEERTPDRPVVSDANPTLPGVVVRPPFEPLDDAAIQAWADFYALFPV